MQSSENEKKTTYCKSFEVKKFCRFYESIGKSKTFTLKHFCFDNGVLKMAGHCPGSFLNRAGSILVIYIPSWGRSLEYYHPPRAMNTWLNCA